MPRWLVVALVLAVECKSGSGADKTGPEPSISPACAKLCRLKSMDEFGDDRGGDWATRAVYRVDCRKKIVAFDAKYGGQGCARMLEKMGESVPH